MRELLSIGKVWELAQAARRTPGRRALRPGRARRAGHRPRRGDPRGAADLRRRGASGVRRAAGTYDPRDARRSRAYRRHRRGQPGGDAGQRDARAADGAARADGAGARRASSSTAWSTRASPRPRRRRCAARANRSAPRAGITPAHARTTTSSTGCGAAWTASRARRCRGCMSARSTRPAWTSSPSRLERVAVITDRLEGKRIVICAGSGGVGKTTTSAALAMGLAGAGRKVAVVTIDPAKRLADSLGLEELGNEPRLVDPERFAGHGIEMRGELWAMMLDAKRTFDELIGRLAPDEHGARRGARQPDLPAALRRGRRARRSSPRSPSSTSSTATAASTRSCSTRRRRATRWTSSTRPTG